MRLVCAVAVTIGGGITIALAELGLANGGSGSSAYYVGGLLFLAGGIISIVEYVRVIRAGIVAPGHETRCRCCNHILSGLSEPRCPECGEKI